MGNLAWLLTGLNRLDEAEEIHRAVVDMRIRQRGPTNESVASALVHLAACEIRLKQFDGSVQHATEAIGIFRARLGEQHPDTAAAYFILSTAYENTKRIDLAEAPIKLVIEIDRQTTIDPMSRSAHLRQYARVLRSEGRKHEAKEAELRAAEIERQDPHRASMMHTVDITQLAMK